MKSDVINVLSSILTIDKSNFNVFGSHLTRLIHSKSDIDICILVEDHIKKKK